MSRIRNRAFVQHTGGTLTKKTIIYKQASNAYDVNLANRERVGVADARDMFEPEIERWVLAQYYWASDQKYKQGETDYKGICELEKELERHLCY